MNRRKLLFRVARPRSEVSPQLLGQSSPGPCVNNAVHGEIWLGTRVRPMLDSSCSEAVSKTLIRRLPRGR